MARKALGRGLEALIPAAVDQEVAIVPAQRATEARHGDIQHVPLAKILRNPAQPRTQFDPATIRELAGSVRERGVLQPVLLRPAGDGFQLVKANVGSSRPGKRVFTRFPPSSDP